MTKKGKVTPFPVRLTALQEMQQQLTEMNPDWVLFIMADDNGYGYLLPPDVNIAEITFAIDVSKKRILENYTEGDFE